MIEGAHRFPYQFIKNLQQAIRKPNGRKSTVKDMLVLSQQNDPFYAGNGVEGEKARWFAQLWERFGYGSGAHLRRVRYRIVSEGNIVKPDGKIYDNNKGRRLSADEANERVEQLKSQGMREDYAVAEAMKRMQRED